MPDEPTILDLIQTASDAVRGQADETADFIRGSDLESINGATAMIWSREAQRDTDLFKASRFNDADGSDLDLLVNYRWSIPRIYDAPGVGTAILARPNSVAGEGTVWEGTRIAILGGSFGLTRFYKVTQDVDFGPSDISSTVPIAAIDIGTAGINQIGGMRIDDILWDSSLGVVSLNCGNGTTYEPAAIYRARVRQTLLDRRVGHVKAITTACNLAGASNVQLFRSDYGGFENDFGLNMCYVGDSGYSATPLLVRNCKIALRKARVLGDNMQVLPMARAVLNIKATVTLRDSPAKFDTVRMSLVHAASIRQYLGGSSGAFTYTRSGIFGALVKVAPEVQNVSFVTPSSDIQILTANNFPAVLNRFVPGDISLTYVGPT